MQMKANFMKFKIYRLSRELSALVWQTVSRWNHLQKSTIGLQVLRSVDSVGANIAEGSGKTTPKERRRYARIARGSLYESMHWIDLAWEREWVDQEMNFKINTIVDNLAPMLNSYIKSLSK